MVLGGLDLKQPNHQPMSVLQKQQSPAVLEKTNEALEVVPGGPDLKRLNHRPMPVLQKQQSPAVL